MFCYSKVYSVADLLSNNYPFSLMGYGDYCHSFTLDHIWLTLGLSDTGVIDTYVK